MDWKPLPPQALASGTADPVKSPQLRKSQTLWRTSDVVLPNGLHFRTKHRMELDAFHGLQPRGGFTVRIPGSMSVKHRKYLCKEIKLSQSLSSITHCGRPVIREPA